MILKLIGIYKPFCCAIVSLTKSVELLLKERLLCIEQHYGALIASLDRDTSWRWSASKIRIIVQHGKTI